MAEKEKNSKRHIDSLSDQLRDLKLNLENRESIINNEVKKKKELKSTIDELEKIFLEIKSLVKSLSDSYKNFEKEKKFLNEFLKKKLPLLDEEAKKINQLLNGKVKKIDSKLNNQKLEIEKLSNAYADANAKYETTKLTYEKKILTYKKLKNYPEKVKKEIDGLIELKKKINLLNDKMNKVETYFLLKELEAGLKNLNYISEDEYEKSLYEAWQEIKVAKGQMETIKIKWEDQKARYDNKEQKYLSNKKNRRELIIKELKAM
jgi:hypothetical protein